MAVVRDPRKVRELMRNLTSEAKIKILRRLLEKGRMTTSETAKELGVTVATALTHLQALEACGLVKSRKGRGRERIFELATKKVLIEVDLNAYLYVSSEHDIERYVEAYVEKAMKGKGLKTTPAPEDIAETLNIPRIAAAYIVEYIVKNRVKVAAIIAKYLEKLLEEKGEINVDDAAKELNTSKHWILLAATHLEKSGKAVLQDSKIVLAGEKVAKTSVE